MLCVSPEDEEVLISGSRYDMIDKYFNMITLSFVHCEIDGDQCTQEAIDQVLANSYIGVDFFYDSFNWQQYEDEPVKRIQ